MTVKVPAGPAATSSSETWEAPKSGGGENISAPEFRQECMDRAKKHSHLADFWLKDILTDTFWNEIWEKKHAIYRQDKDIPDNRMHEEIDAGEIAAAVSRGQTANQLRIFRDQKHFYGIRCPFHAYADGASVIVNQADRG